MNAIETQKLTKTYEGKGGCQDITLTVPKGSIFGFLGPNGAGKSTFVKMLVGLLHPDSGSANILGKPIKGEEARSKVGFLPENFRYHDWLTGEELLFHHGALFGLSKEEITQAIPRVLRQVGLRDREKERVGKYSKGMQQRIGLACALLPDPEVLFLDEPTSALDPLGRIEVRDLLIELREQNKTIFLNSHLLSELETVCDGIAIIKKGRLVFQGDWRELANKAYRVKVLLGPLSQEQLAEIHRLPYEVLSHHIRSSELVTEGRQEFLFSISTDDIPNLTRELIKANIPLYEVTPQIDSLEKLFIDYVKEA
ncbi:ABC transporter ATP-binding protein [Heliorestis acidaminivorans]|uniref:ABC transporter ATP-binding protein n=1 Tax=Heliorestis acidaminivorans TaxID=553427 RepID=A0A6I0EZ47_9FIRM|nr:ABC transporter ATP-binding protein [Heliorestis acidaminivorans]KAB2952672.1 ABC transporter ATP-binding protein [Heliorestis acidaminivorans]